MQGGVESFISIEVTKINEKDDGKKCVGLWYFFNVTEPYTIGIAETQCSASLRVYPNPAGNQLTIDNGELIIENVEIFSVVGQRVGAYPCGRPEMTIDISHLAAGMYFLKIGNKFAKFVKE